MADRVVAAEFGAELSNQVLPVGERSAKSPRDGREQG
jgi:hypothetical protein